MCNLLRSVLCVSKTIFADLEPVADNRNFQSQRAVVISKKMEIIFENVGKNVSKLIISRSEMTFSENDILVG